MDTDWQARVKAILKAELKRRDIGYRELAGAVDGARHAESERNIANKISRGGFSAAFFVECLVAIGCTTVRLEDA